MGWIIVLVLVQLLIAGVVIFVLKRLLDRELMLTALEKLDSLEPVKEITVKYAGHLSDAIRSKIQSILRRKTEGIKVIFIESSELKGGLVIEAEGVVFDFSLAGRLKNFWQ